MQQRHFTSFISDLLNLTWPSICSSSHSETSWELQLSGISVDFVEMGCLFEFQIRQNPCEITLMKSSSNHFESFFSIMAHLKCKLGGNHTTICFEGFPKNLHNNHGVNSPHWLKTQQGSALEGHWILAKDTISPTSLDFHDFQQFGDESRMKSIWNDTLKEWLIQNDDGLDCSHSFWSLQWTSH